MKDKEILNRIKKYFSIHELVGNQTFKKYGEKAWMFLDFRMLWALLIIREGLGRRITINNYYWGGRFSQRGLRTNVQGIFRRYFQKKSFIFRGTFLERQLILMLKE